jgi:hypothetical protein
MNLNDDVVYRCLRLGPLHQLHPGGSRSLVRYHDRLHDDFLLGHLSLGGNVAALDVELFFSPLLHSAPWVPLLFSQ